MKSEADIILTAFTVFCALLAAFLLGYAAGGKATPSYAPPDSPTRQIPLPAQGPPR